MSPMANHSLESLRELLERVARWNIEVHGRDDSIPALAFQFRDCRLEVLRMGEIQMSEEQLHRLREMDYRLSMVVTGHAVPDSVAVEGKRALAAFGWATNT